MLHLPGHGAVCIDDCHDVDGNSIVLLWQITPEADEEFKDGS